MTYKIIFILLLTFIAVNLYAFPSSKNLVPELKFLDLLLKNDSDIINYIDASELHTSNRLGITYTNTPIKFLLNYNVPEEVKSSIINGSKKFHADVHRLEDDYTVLEFALHNKSYSTKFYFKDGKCIAPVTYFSRNFTKDSSDYFTYYISNPIHFNAYCEQDLDEFATQMLDIMMFSDDEKKFLAQNKIIYVLCNNETEISNIIGQNARGIYLVANDAIVSIYNTHYHEIAHLLMNYKIKNNVQPCHYFFLEGFATAFGGRGGLSTLTLFPVAQFSINTGFVNVKSLLSMKDFASEDASITYPVAGFYSLDLFLNKGFDEYLKTYLKFSGNFDYLNSIDSTNTTLPFYNEFLSEASNIIPNPIKIDVNKSAFIEKIIDEPDFKAYVKDEDCLILLKNNLLLKTPDESFNYISKVFTEKFPGREYLTYHYLIEVNSQRVGIYDLFNNNLIYSYNKGFDMQQREVSKDGEYYMFSIPSRLFDKNISDYDFKTIE